MFRPHSLVRLFAVFAFVLLVRPAAAQIQQTVTTKGAAPVFLTPSENQQPLRVAKEGSVLRLLGSEGDWYHVEFEDPQYGRRVGYVRKAYAVLSAPDYSRMAPVDLSVPERPRERELDRDREPIEAPTPAMQRALPRRNERGSIHQGTTELLFSGSVSAANGGGETVSLATIEGTVGYFATAHLEFGGDFSLVKLSDVDPVGTAAGLFAYNFNPEAAAVGFAGGAVGAGFGAGDLNPFIFQFFAGVRVVTPGGGGAFVVRPFYERESFGRGANANVFGVALGVSILF